MIELLEGGLDKDILITALRKGVFHNRLETGISLARIGNKSLEFLKIKQISNINVKNVNQILELAKNKFQLNREGDNFDPKIFITMYILFGKQRTTELIEGKYGELSYSDLSFMFEGLPIKDYEIYERNAEPSHDKYQTALNNFLFASGQNDINANMKKIISGEISHLEFKRMIKEWKIYYDLLGGNITMSDIKEQLKTVDVVLPPNLQEITPTLKIAGITNLNEIISTYEQMQKRTNSTIPKIKGVTGQYEYEMLDLKAVNQMDVGYLTHCCFTFEGASSDSLKDACTSKDSRVFVIKKDGKLVAQSWVWRNGNTLCFDNIESYGISTNIGEKLWEVYESASNDLLKKSAENEKDNKKIQLVTIGEGNTKIGLKGEKLETDTIPKPIGPDLYTDANSQVIVSTSPDYKKPNCYDVEAIYQDERKNVVALDPQQSNQQAIMQLNAHIDKINYSLDPESFTKINSFEDYTYVTYGEDWYIAITNNGEIIKKSYSSDDRSIKELKICLETLQNKIKTGELNYNLNDINELRNTLEEGFTDGTRGR